MTEPGVSPRRRVDAPARRRRVLLTLRGALLQRLPRLFFFAGVSVATGFLLLLAKVALFVSTPDWFLFANIVFVSGSLSIKASLLRKRRMLRKQGRASADGAIRAYRRTGVLLMFLSVAYLIALLPSAFGPETFLGDDLWAALAVTAVAFTEMVLALVASAAGRVDRQPIASALRRTNLATAFIMMALAQSALVTCFGGDGSPKGTAAAVAFGLAAGVIGAGMLRRSESLDTVAE